MSHNAPEIADRAIERNYHATLIEFGEAGDILR